MLHIYLSLIEDQEDRQDFEQLYYTYRKQMIFVASSVLTEEADVEDAVHEVFLKVATYYKQIRQKVQTEDNMRYYLLTATKNTALNTVQKKRWEQEFNENDPRLTNRLSDDEFLQSFCQKEDYETAVQKILALDQRYREVLYIHFVMDLSIEDTAKLLDRKIPTVKTQLIRGKNLLLQNRNNE